ncbi:hypothetical protein Ahy_A08g039065 [Arachis hypogaea]|uniref:PB1-like domain-containing protein n=1 Tax=Arachis hypogaea TaxID=3818 RepID=A0A445BVJ0_ARAHY|nr:hypothetical protein Ahy_A08g039065 [Arachis hypogaea]
MTKLSFSTLMFCAKYFMSSFACKLSTLTTTRVRVTGRKGCEQSIRQYSQDWRRYDSLLPLTMNGPLQYVGGETTVIEEIDSDRLSVFEAYAELKQFGYVEENISALWFKDPTHENMEENLKLFKGDADLIAMYKITELRDYVELYVVHKVEEEDVFPVAGYIDVEEDHGMVNKSEGQELVVYGGEQAGRNQSEPGADDSGAETRDNDDDVNQEAKFGNSGDSDSLDSKYKPSEEEDDNKDDLYFIDCEDELDPDGSGVCCQHMRMLYQEWTIDSVNNFRKRFPWLQLKQLMWKCAKATHWKDWERYMAELKAVNQEAFWYLIAIPPRYWSRSRFAFNSKVDTLVNNMSESFNSTVIDAKEKPIVMMLEEIRVKLMTRLERRSRSAGEWRPYWSATQKYEVVNELDKFAIDLGTYECSCRRGLTWNFFVADYYKKEAYLKCYESVIHPLNRPDFWERTTHPDVMPPPYRRPSHRPMKKRRPTAGDEEQSSGTHLSRKGEKQKCFICGSVEHNKSRCPNSTEDEAQHSKKLSKGKQKKGSIKSQSPATKGERKTASSQPTPKLGVKRKAASTTQPPSLAQSNSATQPKRPRGRLKRTTKPNCSAQHDP